MNGFSVIMPTYNQSAYIRRAIQSLFSQTYQQWELIIINDGCTDNTEIYIQDYLSDNRISYIKNERNKGLGFALNQGLDMAKYEYIAYLPSDDFYYKDHLDIAKKALDESDDRILVYAAADSEVENSIQSIKRTTIQGLFDMRCLQLVQTAHKKTEDRWITRSELVTDDLFQLFWHKLVSKGIFYHIDKITSNWTIHSHQHHVILNEEYGGHFNYYRQYYNVEEPLRVRVSESKFIDEVELYKDFRKPPTYQEDSLKILLVGELSYHPERIYSLEKEGHRLFGLWMERPIFFINNVGHLPFGHIEDISLENWENEIQAIKPDIIYGLLNFGAIPIAYDVIRKFPDIPFIWHYKESPFITQANGTWNKLIELYRLADGKIYLNAECRTWYNQFIPTATGLTYILDGDLPKGDCFTNDFSPKLSTIDGDIHTVLPGRNIGLGLDGVEYLAKQRIHLHIYESNPSQRSFTYSALKMAPKFVHHHNHCSQEHWTKEFSQYDAGWLHCFESKNKGEFALLTWDDLNMPARMSVLAAGGIPMIQKNNDGHIVATQSYLQKIDVGIFFKDYEDLAGQLYDTMQMERLQNNILFNRLSFSFDFHVKDLIDFFRRVIAFKQSHKNE